MHFDLLCLSVFNTGQD